MPTLVPISDPSDPRIAAYRDVRERDLVLRDGMFVAEGKVVLDHLIGSRMFSAQSLLIADRRVASVESSIAGLPDGVPVYVASQSVMDAVAGFAIHRGILAIGKRIEPHSAEQLLAALPARAVVLVLMAIANHDNMGGIFRNAAAFGADAVLIDADCCDPLYRKAIRVSVGAALLVPFARIPRGHDVVELLKRHSVAPVALSPSGGIALSDLSSSARTGILLGAEGPGLDARLLARVTTVRIPMAPGFDSLNVATASGIVLHHLSSLSSRR